MVNYCQHARREVIFDERLTALVGPNGSGKSNIVYAILFALTGDNEQYGTKANNICDIAPPGEQSYVELDFSHNGADYRIIRKLRPTSAKAEFHGSAELVTGDNNVTAAVLLTLGVEVAAIKELMIVPQEAMFGFLNRTPVERLKSWQRVLRFMVAATVKDAVERQMKLYPVVAGPDVATLQAAEVQVGETAAAEARARQGLQGLPDKAAIHLQIVQMTEQLGEYRRQQETLARLQQIEDLLQVDLRSEVTAREQSDVAARQLLAATRPPDVGMQHRQIAALNARLLIPDDPQRPQPRPLPANLDSCPEVAAIVNSGENVIKRLTDLMVKLQVEREKILAYQRSFAAGVCPTCAQPVTRPADLTGDPAVLLAAWQMAAMVKDSVTADQLAYQAWDAALTRVQNQRAESYTQFAAVGLGDYHTAPVEQLRTFLTNLSQQIADANVVTVRYNQLSQASATANALASRATAAVAGRQQELATARLQATFTPVAPVPQVEFEQAQARYRQCVDAEAAVQASQVAALSAVSRLQDLRNLVKASKAAEAWHARASNWAELMSPQAIPKLVMHRAAMRLIPGINTRLRLAQANFEIEITPELEFQANFDDGRIQPDKRLSGGQKDLLGLAFRLALTELTTEGLNVLILDEPTADLDDGYRDKILAVIDHLRESASGSGLQVVIVTHAKPLAERADKVIDLTPGATT